MKELLDQIKKVLPDFNLAKIERIKNEIRKELEGNPPQIALIGETGVGKTTTINAVFNQGLEISHTVPCTKKPKEVDVPVEEYIGTKGAIKIMDMPGLSEDLETDKKHKEVYLEVLPKCDVAVWILKADVRTMTQIQIYLTDVVVKAMKGYDRIVIGLNQVDIIQPGKWNKEANIPSREQESSINTRIDDISKKIQQVCNIPKERIIPYSALKRYRLDALFRGMMDACPHTRAWVLYDRQAIAEFVDLIDPEYIAEVNHLGNISQKGGK